MPEPIVRARNLCKSYGQRKVVRGVDFDVPRGVCFGILGPNGAGKTTLIRMLLGMSPVTSGDYLLFGEPAGGASQRARIGVVPQGDNLDPDFTVRENLLVYASYFGIGSRIAGERMRELLAFAELSERGESMVGTLSGGMRRRLMIARALINDPDLVILDEPTTGLDPQTRHLIWQRLRRLRSGGKTLILTTHYMEEAEQLCDELIILDQGVILEQGRPRQLVLRHVEAEVVEIRGEVSRTDVMGLSSGLDVRKEHVGDTWFCYANDARPLLARCRERKDLEYIHRPGNLEDVFLRLTGRDLRE
jgi:lipooligosaccharide transport system ATP-binding protein